MITTGPYTILEAGSVRVRVSSVDDTAALVDMLCRVMRGGPAGDDGIDVYVHASADPPLGGLFDAEGDLASWRSCWVHDRVLIRESPSRRVYLCGVPGYPGDYPTADLRWHLASFIAGGVLTFLSDRLLLIHGALIADGEAGHVLAGPSGAGKSTAATRVPTPWRALADDMLAAVATADGYVIVPLPTWSVFDADPHASHSVDTGRSLSLAGLWFLEQSPVDLAVPLGWTEAVRRLVENALSLYLHYWDGFDPEGRDWIRENVFRHAVAITGRAPCSVLECTLDGRFWEHLRTV